MKIVATKSVKFNFLMNSILTASNVIFPLITFPYVSRVLTATGTGKVAFATSLVTYFMIFAQLGVPTYGIREVAKVRDDKEALSTLVHELLTLNAITCAVSYICYFGLISWVPRFNDEWILYAVVSASIMFNAIGVEWLYKGLEKYYYITIRSVIFKLIAVIAMLVFIHSPEDYVNYGGISIFASVGSNICNFVNMRKYVYLRPLVTKDFLRHFKPSIVFMAMSIASSVYTNLDIVMLGLMISDAEVGYYNAAIKTRTVLLSFVTSLGAVLLPRLSYYVSHEMITEFNRVSVRALSFVVIVGGGLALFFIPYAYETVMLLAGDGYRGSVLPMQILMPTLLIVGMSNLTGIQILIPLGKEGVVLKSILVGSIVDLIINMNLIPALASVGVAIGTLCAEVAVLIYQAVVLKDVLLPIARGVEWKKISLALVLALVVSTVFSIADIPDFPKLIIGAIVFFAIEFVVLMLGKEALTISIVKEMVQRANRKVLKRGQ